uniref:Uncharacterized protein n=1 Tax=Tetradesmus obliquus TaxID=3088 RepID=A0A383W3T5_TETOB|eukprot:jgi/Sobl393_1/17338/SZX71880.1
MSSGSADDTQQDMRKKRNLLRGEVALYLSATLPGCSSALQQQQQQPPVRIKPEEEAAAPAAPPPPPAAAAAAVAAVAAAAAFVSLLEPVRQQLQQLRSQQQFTAAHEEMAGKALGEWQRRVLLAVYQHLFAIRSPSGMMSCMWCSRRSRQQFTPAHEDVAERAIGGCW